ncbi:MAG: LysR family transcriptional regulator [Proteobacteria bacterium]|nr:LysR family transcriptional regulator [Pseudomonadota bacterium]MCP4915387.1 LysR family transcriptional regulator [Pseudomonadota bacterium]
MWRPTLRQLDYVVAVDEHRNFGVAARRSGVSQPALSKSIREVEEGLGVQLFERGRRGARTTVEGARIVDEARRVLAAARSLCDTAKALGDPFSGEVTLAAIPTLAPYLLPVVVRETRRAFPDLRLRLVELQTDELLEALVAGEIDIGLLATPWPPHGVLVERHVLDDELLVALPPDHPLRSRASVRADELEESSLLLLREGHCLRNHALAACSADPDTALEATSLATLVAMVQGGLGPALVPAMARERDLQGLDLVRLSPPASRGVALWWRPGSARGSLFERLAELLSSQRSWLRSAARKPR